jgi:hypothetical protein
MPQRPKLLFLLLFVFCARNASAQATEEEKEHSVVELGGAAFRSVNGDTANSFGPSVAVEVTPIKHWLELEFGTTALFRRHSTEWGTDLPVQEALGHLSESRIYVRYRPGMGSLQAVRSDDQLYQR